MGITNRSGINVQSVGRFQNFLDALVAPFSHRCIEKREHKYEKNATQHAWVQTVDLLSDKLYILAQ